MKTFQIVYRTENFCSVVSSYAENEWMVDFLHDDKAAVFCTAAFCAVELKNYLLKTDPELDIVYADEPDGAAPCIVLECLSAQPDDGGFSFEVNGEKQLTIRGVDRNGLVNGIYEFLRLQKWEWLEPGIKGEYAPEKHEIIFPAESKVFKPSFKYRAFYFEYPSQASIDFLMWMARSRMNVFCSFPALKPLAQKLGMYILSGGHIITDIMKPELLQSNGKTLFENHADWYGKRADGVAVTPDNAQRTQFCCSNAQLMDYLAEKLIDKLNTEWLGTDILEVGGFDTWGNTCQCEECAKLSDSDKYLRFLSSVRERFNIAFAEGRLPRNPMLNTWAYEGTATMEPPTAVPENMAEFGDNCVAFVINRCYRHAMGEDREVCPINAQYSEIMRNWGKFSDKLALWGGEYYNVSRHEDMPLLFTENIKRSMEFYYNCGAKGITYMHTPIINWGVRLITQDLHALLAWDIKTDVRKRCGRILELRYGKYASAASEIYKYIEDASRDIAEWRAWRESILNTFERFCISGSPDTPLFRRHYKDSADVIKNGRRIVRLFRKAAKLTDGLLNSAWQDFPAAPEKELAVNPQEQGKNQNSQRIISFLSVELRALHYAVDVMQIMTYCAEAYDAICRKDYAEISKMRLKLERLAKKMALYTVGVTYRINVPHIETRSALERSQCRPFIQLLRNYEK